MVNLDAQASSSGLTFKTTGGTGVYNHQGDGSNNASVRLFEQTNAKYVGLKAPTTIGTSLEFILPGADGSANQVLATNGSKVLSFQSVSALLPADVVKTSTGGNWTNDNRLVKTVGSSTQLEETTWVVDDTNNMKGAAGSNLVFDATNTLGSANGFIYFGETTATSTGTWRIGISGTGATNRLIFEQASGTAFVEKAAFAS